MNILRKHAVTFKVTSVSEQIIIIVTIIITISIFTEDVRSHVKARSESSGGAVVRALASHQCGSGSIFKPEVLCGLSLFVLFSALRGFLFSLKTCMWLKFQATVSLVSVP